MGKEETIDGSREAVAFALMKHIADRDAKGLKEQTEDPREYFLDLYNDCLEAVDRCREGDAGGE